MNTTSRRLTVAALLTSLGLAGLSVAIADDSHTKTVTNAAASEVQAANLERAQASNDEALHEALERVLENTRLDLDIRLLEGSSKTVAATN
jgi:hypothetical protein